LDVGGHPVTFWEWVPADDVLPTPRQLGEALRQLHALPTPRFELPRFNPLAGIDALLASASVDPDSLSFLRDECEFLKRAYHDLTFDLPLGPIHGDAHTGNLICSNGCAILIDFETFALGPREWELVPTAVQRERFDLPGADYRAFVEAYGVDVRAWSGYPVVRRIRELTITAWLLGPAAQQRGTSEEFGMRVAALRGERAGRAWRRY
jgi:thiamine kinase-like enzyme